MFIPTCLLVNISKFCCPIRGYILHETKDIVFLKNNKKKIEEHETTKGQDKRETGLKWRKYIYIYIKKFF